MRVHRMTLSHIKGVADRRIDFPDEGIVVVEGQNEAGKTTMIEALDLLLDEKDSSKKRHVLAMRPVGRRPLRYVMKPPTVGNTPLLRVGEPTRKARDSRIW